MPSRRASVESDDRNVTTTTAGPRLRYALLFFVFGLVVGIGVGSRTQWVEDQSEVEREVVGCEECVCGGDREVPRGDDGWEAVNTTEAMAAHPDAGLAHVAELHVASGQPAVRRWREYRILPEESERAVEETDRLRSGEWRPRQEAPYYDDDDGTAVPGRRRLAFIAIPTRIGGDEHEHARRTWLSWARKSGDLEYRFFADPPNMTDPKQAEWVRENQRHGDVVYLNTRCADIAGCETEAHSRYPVPAARRNMVGNLMTRAMIRWALERYRFDFFVRTDTDAYVCVPRLAAELAVRPRRLYWAGSFHCGWQTRVDEAFLVASRDLVRHYVNFVGVIHRYMDPRESFEQNSGHWVLGTYAAFHDSDAHYKNYPAYCRESARGKCTDIPSYLDFKGDPAAVGTAHHDAFVSFCDSYTVVHPIKNLGVLDEIHRRVVVPTSFDVVATPQGLNCSRILAHGTPRRPGRVMEQGISYAQSWWGNDTFAEPTY